MNRFAFPYEWMAENWPHSVLPGAAARPQAPPDPAVEIRLAGATLNVPPGIDATGLTGLLRAVRRSAAA